VAICEVCGNDYDKAFEVVSAGETHMFDSFECAIHALAPLCAHCGCRVIGHGVETDGRIFCCASASASLVSVLLPVWRERRGRYPNAAKNRRCHPEDIRGRWVKDEARDTDRSDARRDREHARDCPSSIGHS
jgi:hypothetical protein